MLLIIFVTSSITTHLNEYKQFCFLKRNIRAIVMHRLVVTVQERNFLLS